jgi:hypothetical protein
LAPAGAASLAPVSDAGRHRLKRKAGIAGVFAEHLNAVVDIERDAG